MLKKTSNSATVVGFFCAVRVIFSCDIKNMAFVEYFFFSINVYLFVALKYKLFNYLLDYA